VSPAPAAEYVQRTRTIAPILVVDDDPAILDIVVKTLDFEGYPTARATNGAEALNAIERRRPSLVLLDMRMPVMDGWTFAKELAERNVDVPILVMTAAHDARRWASEVGAVGYVEKPFDIEELLDAVQRALEGS
jgi:two-component system, chemotaxis family, chemotaxis protein CheY